MKPLHLSKNVQRSIAAILILVLSSCSSSRGSRDIGNNTSPTRHPTLLLQSSQVSPSRMISDAELVNAKNLRTKKPSLSVGATVESALIVTGTVVVGSFLVAAGIYSGFGPPEMHWPTNMPKLFKEPSLRSCAITNATNCQIKLSGAEIRYVPSKKGKDLQIARVRGNARIDIIDRFGSYYCRADEIHYRATTNEIILNGRASVSAAYAPGIHDYGLARVDLNRGILEYSSKENPRHFLPNPGADGLAMVQPKVSQP
jgi:hypothetical protein